MELFFWHGFEVISAFHRHKWVQGIWFLLFLGALFLLLYRRSSQDYKKIYKHLFIYLLIYMLVAYFPPLAGGLVGKYMASELEYERITWGVFFVPIISLVCTNVVWNPKDIKNQNKRIIILLAIMFLASNRYVSSIYVIPNNKYEINSESLELAEYIESHPVGENDEMVVIFQLPYDRYAVDQDNIGTSIYYGIRRFSGVIQLSYLPMPQSMCEGNEDTFQSYLNDFYGEGCKHPYCIAEPNIYIDRSIRKAGYSEVLRTQHAVLYKVREQ